MYVRGKKRKLQEGVRQWHPVKPQIMKQKDSTKMQVQAPTPHLQG